MKLFLAALVALAVSSVIPLQGQTARWAVTTDLQAGLYLPTRDLGTSGVTTGRMRQAPVLGASLRFGRIGSPLGLYLATTQALQGGLRARPTPDCVTKCQAQTVDHGRFWTLTAGVTVAANLGATQLAGSLGGGVRTYATFGRTRVLVVPQPGEFSIGEFLNPTTDPAVHVALQVGRRLGTLVLFVRLEDFIADSDLISGIRDHRTFHDLLISLGAHLRWPSRS